MRKLFLLAVGSALVAGAPLLAQGHGNGNGGGKGGGGHADRGGGPGNGGGQGHGNGRGGPPGQEARGNGVGKGNGGENRGQQMRVDRGPQQNRVERGPDRAFERGQQMRGPDRPERSAARGNDNDQGRGNGNGRGRGPGGSDNDQGRGNAGRVIRDAAPVAVVRDDGRGNWDRGRNVDDGRVARNERVRYVDSGRYYAGAPTIIDGCPPGLAKKNNGCLPPGQARKIWGNAQPYDNWYGNWSSWQNDPRYDYRYDDGYLYRVDSGSNLISGFLPLLGGALFGGNLWPQSYDNSADYAVPQYYDDYYGYDDSLDYRYADGAILGVNPGTNGISGIAALLTGNQWNVGQRAPDGYDFYNVPPEYRDRYIDGADANYRYSDGYVYQIDPTSKLVEKVIQLLT